MGEESHSGVVLMIRCVALRMFSQRGRFGEYLLEAKENIGTGKEMLDPRAVSSRMQSGREHSLYTFIAISQVFTYFPALQLPSIFPFPYGSFP